LICLYILLLLFLSLIIPDYGDPATHVRTANRVMSEGSTYDDACNCIRPPLWYVIVGYASMLIPKHAVLNIIFFVIYLIVLSRLARGSKYPFSVLRLMFPPMYILSTRHIQIRF